MLELIFIDAIRVEPCGLNQMYSCDMVQFYCEKTGGLKDTVIDFGDNGNGISHDQSSVGDICYSIKGQSTCIKIRTF
jgi:starch synthase